MTTPHRSETPLVLAALLALAGTASAQDPASRPAKERAPAPAVTKESPETDEEAIALADKIEKIVEEVRGLKFKQPVKKGVYDKERLAKFLEEQIKKDKMDEQFGWQEKAYKLFGLLPQGFEMEKEMKELLLEQIGGFYDPETKELRVMRGFGGLVGEILMAHELCHALEDQHFDLKAIDDAIKEVAPEDDDRQFAAHAVMEGSATDLMNRFAMKRMMSGGMSQENLLDSIDMTNPAFRGEKAGKAPPILVRPLMEMYMGGLAFLARGSVMGGAKRKDVKTAFLSPPLSSEQVIHPEKYWDTDARDLPMALTLPDASAWLGEGWKRRGTNVLGEIGVAILTAEKAPDDDADDGPTDPMKAAMKMLGGEKTTLEATGWDGDRYELYEGPEGSQLLLWVSAWDSARDAREMQDWWNEHLSADSPWVSKSLLRAPSGAVPLLACLRAPKAAWKTPSEELLGKILDGTKLVEQKPLERKETTEVK